uniref:DUF5824 domain-containing protein n=1 Tax=viral metagenome TaxID=1070528 RepID=A0A6C0H5Z3_9ZZZZ
MKIPKKYIPSILSDNDKIKQKKNIIKTRKYYKKNIYVNRPFLKSFKSKKSNHIVNAIKQYSVKKIIPNKELSKKTKCSINSLKKIVNKGEGAYYSSGSRPNQTAKSWGLARLASAITHGKASRIDKDILIKGCSKNSPVFPIY